MYTCLPIAICIFISSVFLQISTVALSVAEGRISYFFKNGILQTLALMALSLIMI